jgi:hypothetical protein
VITADFFICTASLFEPQAGDNQKADYPRSDKACLRSVVFTPRREPDQKDAQSDEKVIPRKLLSVLLSG